MNKALSFQKLISILLPCLVGWICAYLAMFVFRNYAMGLFIWLPLVMGMTSTLILSYHNPTPRRSLRNNAYLTLLIFSVGFLLFAWEGVICLVMAAPIAFLGTYVGFVIGHAFIKSDYEQNTPTIVIIATITVPLLMSFENKNGQLPEIRSVVTAIEIDAPMETVWENVVSFPQLKEPKEFLFKTGIAYPINATISGTGVGAIRNCNFSTGSFVEPITIWNKPNLLRFSVVEQPIPMKEISPYAIEPNHLHGYWVSKQGQFKLTHLANGHTLLEGTTWYVNKIAPSFYWTLWSDHIVHKIHTRVLEHIKQQCEGARQTH